jgi:hypothetical protein
MYVQDNIEARSRNHWCRRKSITITYYYCVFVYLPSLSDLQFASFTARLALPQFPHYLIKSKVFGQKIIAHKMRVFTFSTNFVWNILQIIVPGLLMSLFLHKEYWEEVEEDNS